MKGQNPLLSILVVFLVFITINTPIVNSAQDVVTSNQSISSQGTIVYPEPSPTPTPTVSKVNSIWMDLGDLSQTAMDRIIAGKITQIFLEVGEWKTDGTILYYFLDYRYHDFITAVKAQDSNIKVYARIFAIPGYQESIDVTTADKRQKLVNSAVTCVNKGFDGFNDDIEAYIGSTQNLVDYWNAMSQAMRNINKLSSVCAMCNWEYPVEEMFPQLNVDYICPMIYSTSTFDAPNFKMIMNRVLLQSASKVIISGYPTVGLSNVLSWIDQQLALHGDYTKLAGFSWWQFKEMTSDDWTAYINWPTKN